MVMDELEFLMGIAAIQNSMPYRNTAAKWALRSYSAFTIWSKC